MMSRKRGMFIAVLLAALFAARLAQAAEDAAAAVTKLEGLLLHTRYREAEAQAKQMLAAHPKSPSVRCVAARLHAARGRYQKALDELSVAIKLDFKSMQARARKAELLELLGRHDEAVEVAEAVIDFYNDNSKSIKQPRELVGVGLALKLVNAPKDALTILTKAQRADKTDHVATVELGQLFLLKGQVTDASGEFNTVLRADAKHPDALLGLAYCAFAISKLEDAEKYAKEALKAAPNAVDAFDLLAAMAAIDDDFDGAQAYITKSLAVNPNGIFARAILAGCHLVRGNKKGYEQEEAFVRKISPRCPDFYTYVGRACSGKRRMRLAEQMYRTAIRLRPDAHDAMAELGRHLFREARYTQAKKLLDESHDIDGFNVRTYNTLHLLDAMESYRIIKAAPSIHIMLKNETDGVLAEYVKRFAIRSLDDLCKIYDFRPADPVTIEVLPTQRYFATRCIGLPHIGAIGVCFGRVVAFTTPRVQNGRVNWRETLRHELTHAVTLLGTNYRIPHWLTEAMAVHEQHSDRPYNWDVLLKTSVRLNRIMPIGKLTRGFTRPKTGEQRMLAYCQSEVVLDFLIQKCGRKCLPALVKAFREGKELPQAIQTVTGMPLAEFEKQFTAYIFGVVAKIPVLPKVTPKDAKTIIDLAAKQPHNAETQCNLAILLLVQRKPDEAAKAADKALKINPKCAEAHHIKARIAMAARKEADAMAMAKLAIAADKNYAPAHHLLGALAARQNKTDEAAAAFREAIRSHPQFPKPYQALAKIYKDKKQDDKRAEVFEKLLRHTSNSFGQAVELGRHYVSKKKWKDAARVADVAAGIGPFYPQPHIIAGHALWELGKEDPAVHEMEIASICAGDTLKQMEALYRRLVAARRQEQADKVQESLNEARKETAGNNLRLAKAYLKRGDKKKARTAALAALDLDPNGEEIKALLRRIK